MAGFARNSLCLGAMVFVTASAGVLSAGSMPAAVIDPSAAGAGRGPLFDRLNEPLSRLLIQVIVIVLATRIAGRLFTRAGQPAVCGEVIAGILLGPSLLGWLWPEAHAFIFPERSMEMLQILSQIGICLFMFVVGMELDVRLLRQKAFQAVVVSQASMVVPFIMGILLALGFYSREADSRGSFTSFALFMGIALSITAFPVLARILKERAMEKTPLGSTAIACAAFADVSAWVVLSFVVALARSTGFISTVLAASSLALFVAAMLGVARPLLKRVMAADKTSANFATGHLVAALIVMLVSALATEFLGVHALFGAFLAGVIMPQSNGLRGFLVVRLESFGSAFLLPLFFAFSGLRTRLGLLDDWPALVMCVSVIGVATLGKIGGTSLAARWTGMGWIDAFSLGALMNTRGLIELVALNLGYDLGILSPRVFTAMVIMALVTTLLTAPLLKAADAMRRRIGAQVAA